MGGIGNLDLRELRRLQERLNQAREAQAQALLEKCTKDLASMLLRRVVKKTPVGDYSGGSYTCASGRQHKGQKVPGKNGGTLRRGWTAGTIRKEGDVYKIDIINPVEYAAYVEFGHRTASHTGWVPGHLMMTISEQEVRDAAPAMLRRRIRRFLGEYLQ